MLHIEQLTKDYGSFRALDRLDLRVEPGEIFGLLGPNGSGKSTALRLLLGFLRPTSGRATIAGFDCWRQSVQVRRHLAYLPGELRLYENMTGRQLLHFLGELRGHPDPDDERAMSRAFDIDLARPIAHLSSGMKRKLALMLMLLPKTPLLILDEPTNTLDPTMRDQLLEQLVRARERGQAVLFSSHVLSEVDRVCDRVGILQRGRLVHVQRMSELRNVRRVQATFADGMTSMPTLPNLRNHRWEGSRLTLEYAGELPPLLAWLAEQPTRDLQIEPLGLGPLYHRFHGNGA